MEQTMMKQGGGRNSCHFAHSVTKIGRILNSTNKSKAFTLAEVLITLAIIGIVAALTIPTVITNYQKNTYVTQLKKNYNYLSNGFRTMMANEGVTKLTDTTLWAKMPSSGNKLANADFVNELKKTFNITKVYDGSSGNKLNGNKITYMCLENGEECNSYSSGVVLSDGSILYLSSLAKTGTTGMCMAGYCKSLREYQKDYNTSAKLWHEVGVIDIDVNGLKGPNKVGRDWFEFILSNDGNLYPSGGIDSAVLYARTNELDGNIHYWKTGFAPNDCGVSAGYGCAGRIIEEGWKMNY